LALTRKALPTNTPPLTGEPLFELNQTNVERVH
jgi:hypothetical protein